MPDSISPFMPSDSLADPARPGHLLLNQEGTVQSLDARAAALLGLGGGDAGGAIAALLRRAGAVSTGGAWRLQQAITGGLAGTQAEPVQLGGMRVEFTALPPAHLLLSLVPDGATDTLTGLPGRGQLMARLAELLASGSSAALLLLRMNRLDSVGDTLGQAAMETVLRHAAGRLQGALRVGDIAARLPGRGFAVLLQGAGPSAATALAGRLLELMARPFDVGGAVTHLNASIGLAYAPEDGTAAESLLRRVAMAGHAANPGSWRAYEREMEASAEARLVLEAELRRAVPLGQFELHYQPQQTLETGALTGFEALLRWRHPDVGLVPPGEFIPLAEETGLILPIGEWVIHQACRASAAWPGDGLTVAVNVSPRQVEEQKLAEIVSAALRASGLPASRLEIEVTETALLGGTDSVEATLAALRRLGVQISLDDFGTGYSSLTQLSRFPFDRIKIDRSFVSDHPRSKAILRAVAGMGRAMGMRTTAEGVETAEQLRRIRAHGCTEAQGYLLGRPVPEREVPALIREWQARAPQVLACETF
ncbi:putative bifunctional diguanylate cyclase/phosphodiesterase [Muricoccus radiodurans]|uniref:putative bifunctional diguanylate cyclase/phosphodiesterase n=1 Tax=Muricoccus radiodurans TaxID=2231721 RepID=UPI003CEE205D